MWARAAAKPRSRFAPRIAALSYEMLAPSAHVIIGGSPTEAE
jgi:hypothetical protein